MVVQSGDRTNLGKAGLTQGPIESSRIACEPRIHCADSTYPSTKIRVASYGKAGHLVSHERVYFLQAVES
jgi:hypothetical protein